MSEDPSAKFKQARQLGLLTTIPFLLAVSPVIGFFGGRWLDERFGTGPVLALVLLGLGFVAGIRETVRVLRKASRAAEDADEVG